MIIRNSRRISAYGCVVAQECTKSRQRVEEKFGKSGEKMHRSLPANGPQINSGQALFVRSRYGFTASEAASFWKRGSFRSGSNIGSSRSSAGVSGALGDRGL